MKIQFFRASLILSILAITGEARSADQPAAPTAASTNGIGPKIQFATPSYDFGRAVSGVMVKHDFVFTNTGDATLEVTGVTPGCGCTTIGEWTRTVEPGKTGIIPIQFNTTGYNGQIAKHPSLACNDKSQPSVTLELHGQVFKPIEVTPPYVALNVPPDSEGEATGTAHILNNDDTPLTLSMPQTNWRGFTAEIKTNTPGKDFDLIIKTVPPLGAENPQGVITVHTSCPQMPDINVMAIIVMQPAVEANPSQITLPPGPLTSNMTFTISLFRQGAKPIALSDASVNAAGAKVKLEETIPGRNFTATVTFSEGFQAPFGPATVVSIKTDRARFPVIYIPITHMPAATPPQTAVPIQVPPAAK
jgi:hypothetical protein